MIVLVVGVGVADYVLPFEICGCDLCLLVSLWDWLDCFVLGYLVLVVR